MNKGKKKEIVITGRTVMRFAGICGIIACLVNLLFYVFGTAEINWCMLLASLGGSITCLVFSFEVSDRRNCTE